MTPQQTALYRILTSFLAFLFLVALPGPLLAEPSPAAISAFNSYVASLEFRLAQQHRSATGFLGSVLSDPEAAARLRHGELLLEQLTPPTGDPLPGALLHHWRGTAFVPGATPADFVRLMRNLRDYPQHFAPEVIGTQVLAADGDHLRATMRVRQHHVITVVLDTTYDITFAQPDPRRGYITSRSTHIAEIDSPGTPAEHPLSPAEDHGFLWRMNTYWSYEQRDGGLYMQIESVSLTRSIPRGLAWAVGPYLESIPRESLEFTLRSTCNALRK